MKTKTQDSFVAEFDRVITNFERAYDEAHQKFLELAHSNPADAVRYAEGVIIQKRTAEALRYAKSLLDDVGDVYPTRLAAVLAAVDEFRKSIALEATNSRSTSDFANGIDRANLCGLSRAANELEYLSRHYAINEG